MRVQLKGIHNDIRRKENKSPLGLEGDTYHMPLNWAPLGTVQLGARAQSDA